MGTIERHGNSRIFFYWIYVTSARVGQGPDGFPWRRERPAIKEIPVDGIGMFLTLDDFRFCHFEHPRRIEIETIFLSFFSSLSSVPSSFASSLHVLYTILERKKKTRFCYEMCLLINPLANVPSIFLGNLLHCIGCKALKSYTISNLKNWNSITRQGVDKLQIFYVFKQKQISITNVKMQICIKIRSLLTNHPFLLNSYEC